VVSTDAPGAGSCLAPVERSRFLLLGLILLLAAALRLAHLDSQGLWFDELCSLSSANGWGLMLPVVPGWGVVRDEPKYSQWRDARPLRCVVPAVAASDDHPPLYFLLLRATEAIAGDGEVALRIPSVVASLAAIALLYAVARQRHDAATALAACAVMAVAGPQIEFAQQARQYVFLVLLSIAIVWALLRVQRSGGTLLAAMALAAAALAGMLTHYLAVAACVAAGAYALLELRGRSRVAALAALGVAGLAFCLMWGPMVVRQLPTMAIGHAWMVDNQPGRLWRLGRSMFELPVRFLIEPDFSAASHRLLLMGGLLWLALPAALWRADTRLWAMWLIAAVGVTAASDCFQHTTQMSLVRFTIGATPPFYLLLASTLRGRLRWLPAGAAVLLAATNVSMAYDPPWKNDLRAAGLGWNRDLSPDDAIVFVSPDANGRRTSQWLHQYEHFLTTSPKVIALLHDPADPATLKELGACREVWVAWAMQDRTPQMVLRGFKIKDGRPLPPSMELYEGTIVPTATQP
jgi:hypothetical protein